MFRIFGFLRNTSIKGVLLKIDSNAEHLMKHVLILIFLCSCIQNSFAHRHIACDPAPNLFQTAGKRLHQIMTEGQNELYLPTYAWHNRYLYSQTKLQTYNENPWGGGLGKSFYDENGNWHGLFAFAFLDSHKNVEPVVGYAYLKTYHFNENFRIGAGYTALVTARPDIFHNIPFPGVLPWVSINYRRVSLSGTYVPGAQGAGNVLFLVTKILL